MLIPISVACCVRCGFRKTKLCVDDLIDNMPEEATTLCIQHMLRPTMRRIAKLDPTSMPPRWLEKMPTRLPEIHENTARSLITVRYWEICRILGTLSRIHRIILEQLHSLAIAILRKLHTVPGIHPGDISRAWFQVNLMSNTDSAASVVLLVSESPRSLDSSAAMVENLAECGALRYALTLAENIQPRFPTGLEDLRLKIKSQIRNEEHRMLLLATAITDADSSLHILGRDMIWRIAQLLRPPRIILWEDLLRPYIDHHMVLEVAE